MKKNKKQELIYILIGVVGMSIWVVTVYDKKVNYDMGISSTIISLEELTEVKYVFDSTKEPIVLTSNKDIFKLVKKLKLDKWVEAKKYEFKSEPLIYLILEEGTSIGFMKLNGKHYAAVKKEIQGVYKSIYYAIPGSAYRYIWMLRMMY